MFLSVSYFDPDYQVMNGASTLFREEGTTYDKLGRLTEKRETVDGISSTYGYAYDQVGQLKEVRKNGSVVESYSYDANGNRNGHIVDGQDRMLSDGTATYTYTANGELKTKTVGSEVSSYEYDVQGNLIKTTLPTGMVLENVIDPSGRIISRKLNGAVVNNLIWESSLRPAAMLDASGVVTARFVYATNGINVPDYMIKDGVTFRLVKDRLGSVRAVVNIETGEVVQKISYDSFGKVTENTNPDFQPFGFAGGLYESKTGLVRFGARDYDAEVGRWTDKEPLGFNAEENFYRYCHNDPVNYIDPNGEYAIPNPLTIFVGTALIGAAYFAYLDWLHNPDKGGALVLPDFDPIGSICETVHGEDPAGKTGKGSSWQTHSDRRAGERYGKDRNANRGDKNKKYEKPKNKNKLKKDK